VWKTIRASQPEHPVLKITIRPGARPHFKTPCQGGHCHGNGKEEGREEEGSGEEGGQESRKKGHEEKGRRAGPGRSRSLIISN
jgi:hypothetical protein